MNYSGLRAEAWLRHPAAKLFLFFDNASALNAELIVRWAGLSISGFHRNIGVQAGSNLVQDHIYSYTCTSTIRRVEKSTLFFYCEYKRMYF